MEKGQLALFLCPGTTRVGQCVVVPIMVYNERCSMPITVAPSPLRQMSHLGHLSTHFKTNEQRALSV